MVEFSGKKAYEQYYRYGVEQPLARARSEALRRILEQAGQTGTLRSGVSIYPQLDVERSYADALAAAGSGLAREQAERDIALAEAKRQRDFQREMEDTYFYRQKALMEDQRKYAEQQGWMQLLAGLGGSLLGGPIATIGTSLSDRIGRLFDPNYVSYTDILRRIFSSSTINR